MPEPRASVVVATYNRPQSLALLLEGLAKQTLPRDDFEVVVVDDGSAEDVTPVVSRFEQALSVTLLRQENSGVAVARQRGVERASGRIIVFLDDDMRVREDFVAQHLAQHDGHDDRVILGRLLAPAGEQISLFERSHAYRLDRLAELWTAPGSVSGHNVYTGNMSLPRELFFRAGGFDKAFFIEDTELGVRLQAVGAQFFFAPLAASEHASDHMSLDAWLRRAVKEGRGWVQLMRKHPGALEASPWSMFTQIKPVFRPVIAGAVVSPPAGEKLARWIYKGAEAADSAGMNHMAMRAIRLVYSLQFFAGVRAETGTVSDVVKDYRRFRKLARTAA